MKIIATARDDCVRRCVCSNSETNLSRHRNSERACYSVCYPGTVTQTENGNARSVMQQGFSLSPKSLMLHCAFFVHNRRYREFQRAR